MMRDESKELAIAWKALLEEHDAEKLKVNQARRRCDDMGDLLEEAACSLSDCVVGRNTDSIIPLDGGFVLVNRATGKVTFVTGIEA